MWIRDPSLLISIQADGSFLARIPTRALAARIPPPVLELSSFCASPRSDAELSNRYGPNGASAFRQLQQIGLLVPVEDALQTPQFFSNFAALDVHRRMLSDAPRLDAYADAIRRAVRPGMAVLDAGTGSGILAALAALAGARVVYAVDNAEILASARSVIERSGLLERVHLLKGDFRTIDLPEPVDLVITETFGTWAFAEGGVEDLLPTCKRFLAEGGRVIPEGVRLWMVPIKGERLPTEALGAFRDYRGVRLDALSESARHRGITVDLRPDEFAAPPVMILQKPLPCAIRSEIRLEMEVEGEITGLGCWFDLEMGEGEMLSTHPQAPATHWRQCYLPLRIPGTGLLSLEVEIQAAAEDRRGLEVSVLWKRGAEEGREWYRLR